VLHPARLQLPANFAVRVRRAVHIDVQVAGLESPVLLVGEHRPGRHTPGVGPALLERNRNAAILTRRSFMDVGGGLPESEEASVGEESESAAG